MIFKGVIIVAGIAFGILATVVLFSGYFEDSQKIDEQEQNNETRIVNIAKQFIVSSPTFSYDGIAETLEIDIISSNTSDSNFLLEGKFKTTHSGYGNRTKLDLSEDITSHTIEVLIVDEKIISAVIDNQWDELNQITCHTVRC